MPCEIRGRFHRGGIIQGVLLYTMNPWKTTRKSTGEWDYRTRIIPLLLSMKPGLGPKDLPEEIDAD
jgi:hypothetical protein